MGSSRRRCVSIKIGSSLIVCLPFAQLKVINDCEQIEIRIRKTRKDCRQILGEDEKGAGDRVVGIREYTRKISLILCPFTFGDGSVTSQSNTQVLSKREMLLKR